MTSMAAALAASLPAPVQAAITSILPQQTKVPQKLEGVVDPEATKAVESVQLNSLVFLKIMKHSTDNLPSSTNSATAQQDRNAPPQTNLSAKTDAMGVLLGLDLDGVMEVEDCLALISGEISLGPASYSSNLLQHLRDVSSPDSPIGVYLSTHNGGYVTRAAIDLLVSVEKATSRGKGILIIHDAARASGGDLSVKAYVLSEGARVAAKARKWDTQSLVENRITPSTLLTSLPITISSPAIISAFLKTLTTPTPSESSTSKPPLGTNTTPLPPTFSALTNPLSTSFPNYLSDTLDALTLHNHEANNIAFLARQIAREKVKHEGLIREREEENLRRRKQGQVELPSIPNEMRNGTKDPSRLEMICLQGQVDGLAKGMGAEAGKGLVRCYL